MSTGIVIREGEGGGSRIEKSRSTDLPPSDLWERTERGDEGMDGASLLSCISIYLYLFRDAVSMLSDLGPTSLLTSLYSLSEYQRNERILKIHDLKCDEGWMIFIMSPMKGRFLRHHRSDEG